MATTWLPSRASVKTIGDVAPARGRSGHREPVSRYAALADSARELLRRNLGTAASLPAFECMNRAYRDATQGDRYDIEWHPADGLRLRLNGRTLAQCPAPAAAAGYFSIWFGESPFQARTRDALLGQALSRG